MDVSASQLTADRDRRFADWAEAVTYREVTESYNTETGEVSEQLIDTALTAVIGPAPARPTQGTAAGHRTIELKVIVKAEQLPVSQPAATDRIVRGGTEYEVVGFERSADGLTYILDCRRRS